MTSRKISDLIAEDEAKLVKYKAVQAMFPNAKMNGSMEFVDKQVNRMYTHFRFYNAYGSLYVIPYCEVSFTLNNQEETIPVYASPKKSKLASISWRLDPETKKKVIKFSRLAINMKNNNFKGDMLNSCKAEIMNFIKDNPGHHLDTKHLEPRLRKLLMFT